MSMEDCILYRKIGDEWYVLGYGTTYHEADFTDDEFREAARVVTEDELFETLDELSDQSVTEFGICYAGQFITDPPEIVPPEHRVLCCLPPDE